MWMEVTPPDHGSFSSSPWVVLTGEPSNPWQLPALLLLSEIHSCDAVLHSLSCYSQTGAILVQLIPLGVPAAREERQEGLARGFLNWRIDFGRPCAAALETDTSLGMAFKVQNSPRDPIPQHARKMSCTESHVQSRPWPGTRVHYLSAPHTSDLTQLPGMLL